MGKEIRTVLCIRDAALLSRSARILGSEGHRVTSFSDPAEALALLRTEPADLFLTEVGQDGELDEFVRACALAPGLRGIVLAPHGGREIVARALEAGADGVLIEPITPEALLATVRQAVQRRDESVLVVDDDPIIRNLALEVLGEEGYRVVGAGSGEEAVRAARRQPFDLAVLDWNMPGMNGIETFRALRGFRPALAGLMITGYGSPDLLERARDEGITEFLMKPFTLQSLAEAVGRLSAAHAAGGPTARPQSRAATPSRLR